MRIAGSSLAFSRKSLEEALKALSSLGFHFLDLGAIEGWAHLNPSEVMADPKGVAEQVRTLCDRFGLVPVALNAGFGTDEIREQRRQLEGLCRFAQSLGISVLTLGAKGRGTPLEEEISRCRELVPIAKTYGITLTLETHFNRVTEDPQIARKLIERVEGLGLTLDPSHFVLQGYTLADFCTLLPFVAHVHLRDANVGGREKIQVPVGEGKVDFEGLIAALKERNYGGALSCEYIDTIGSLDIPKNLRYLKGLLEELISR